MTPPIVFYDIPSTLPNKCWSPNTWKTRYALNFKGIPYKTSWVEYPDIEPLSREVGAAPTRNKPDGRPHYTLPMIHDPSTVPMWTVAGRGSCLVRVGHVLAGACSRSLQSEENGYRCVVLLPNIFSLKRTVTAEP
ncbi:hypothetical protein FB451DRAFT_1234964 [Mycena latifolia]|nr:hypothetical protein FB451DRAFT_1234964 [Mycena latifolia]